MGIKNDKAANYDQYKIDKQKGTIELKVGKNQIVFFMEDVDLIKSDLGYTVWQINDKKILQRISITDLYESLKAHKFLRTHRKYIVNMDKISQVSPRKSSITMLKGDIIPISRRNKK